MPVFPADTTQIARAVQVVALQTRDNAREDAGTYGTRANSAATSRKNWSRSRGGNGAAVDITICNSESEREIMITNLRNREKGADDFPAVGDSWSGTTFGFRNRATGSGSGERSLSADTDPSSVADFIRATFSHKGKAERGARLCDYPTGKSLVF
jgi:hypothetical protein